jgi:hypothetical protein
MDKNLTNLPAFFGGAQSLGLVRHVAASGFPSAYLESDLGQIWRLHSALDPEREGDVTRSTEGHAELMWGDWIVVLGLGLGYGLQGMGPGAWRDKKVLLVELWPEFCGASLHPWMVGLEELVIWMPRDYGNPQGALDSLESLKSRLLGVNIQILSEIENWDMGPAQTVQFWEHPSWAYRELLAGAKTRILEQWRLRPQSRNVHAFRQAHPQVASGLRVLLTSEDHFLEREIRRAAGELAWEICVGSAAKYSPAVLSRRIQEEQIDFVLSVNGKGLPDSQTLGTWGALGIPVVLWCVDDPRPILQAWDQECTQHWIVGCWERAWMPWLAERVAKVFWLPLAGDAALFGGESVGSAAALGNSVHIGASGISVIGGLGASNAESAQRHPEGLCAEFGFLGSAMGESFEAEIRSRFAWRDAYEDWVQKHASELARGQCGADQWSRRLVADSFYQSLSGARLRQWMESLVLHRATHLRRVTLMKALTAQLDVRVQGDPQSWQAVGIAAGPDLNYHTQTPDFYRQCRVILNITSGQMPSAVNQRIFDVPLAGGMWFSDHQGDLDLLFEGVDLQAWTYPPGNVAAFVEGALEISKRSSLEIREMSQKLRHVILQKHLYKHRLERMRVELGF